MSEPEPFNDTLGYYVTLNETGKVLKLVYSTNKTYIKDEIRSTTADFIYGFIKTEDYTTAVAKMRILYGFTEGGLERANPLNKEKE